MHLRKMGMVLCSACIVFLSTGAFVPPDVDGVPEIVPVASTTLDSDVRAANKGGPVGAIAGECSVICWEEWPPCDEDQHTTDDSAEIAENEDHEGDCVPGGDCDIEHPFCDPTVGGGGDALVSDVVAAWRANDVQALKLLLLKNGDALVVNEHRNANAIRGGMSRGRHDHRHATT